MRRITALAALALVAYSPFAAALDDNATGRYLREALQARAGS